MTLFSVDIIESTDYTDHTDKKNSESLKKVEQCSINPGRVWLIVICGICGSGSLLFRFQKYGPTLNGFHHQDARLFPGIILQTCNNRLLVESVYYQHDIISVAFAQWTTKLTSEENTYELQSHCYIER